MPDPINAQVWAIIGQWLVYGASISGAVMAIAQFIKWCRSKTTVAKLEATINEHTTYLTKDNARIKRLEERIDSVDKDLVDIHNLMRLNVKASQALLKSTLDGDNKEEIKEASKAIQEYMNNQL